ncbi:hypothetical protein ACFGVR_03435 [Mucilaginibacter sp. AW1-3]
MYTIYLAIATLTIIAAISFFKEKLKKRLTTSTFHISELDYLHSYKGILLRMIQMEKDIRGFEAAITTYNTTDISPTANPVILKNELNGINIRLKELIETYAVGELSLSNIAFELDLLNNRLNVVSLLVAA